jgi:hypothetical protein
MGGCMGPVASYKPGWRLLVASTKPDGPHVPRVWAGICLVCSAPLVGQARHSISTRRKHDVMVLADTLNVPTGLCKCKQSYAPTPTHA